MNPYRVVLCLGCRAEWQVPSESPTPGHDYELIGCKCPPGSEPQFVWTDEPLCRHCGELLIMTTNDYWVHAHRLYRCQRKVTYGHNAAHPDVPCASLGPINQCKCVYAPDETSA